MLRKDFFQRLKMMGWNMENDCCDSPAIIKKCFYMVYCRTCRQYLGRVVDINNCVRLTFIYKCNSIFFSPSICFINSISISFHQATNYHDQRCLKCREKFATVDAAEEHLCTCWPPEQRFLTKMTCLSCETDIHIEHEDLLTKGAMGKNRKLE